jgi:hypothetical protein
VHSEKLPHTPFDPVPDDSAPHPFGDGNAQPAAIFASHCADSDKVAILNSLPGIRQCQEFRSSQDPLRFMERLPGHTAHLGCQRGTSPPLQNGSNSARHHYRARRFRPLARLRLITLCPALVDMRFRNPWFLALLNLLG